MYSFLTRSALVLSAGALTWLVGCHQPHHTMSDENVATKSVCKMCYDRTVTVSKMHPKGVAFGGRRTIVKHMCPDCNTDAEIYSEGGRLMLKCAGCAPEGHPCDKCVPRASGA